MKRIYLLLPIFVIWILSLPAIMAQFHPGLIFGHSALINLSRLVELDILLKEGEIFPRWFGDFFFGYGYPLFNYYPPLAYYLAELFHLLGLDYVNALKALDIFSFFFSGLSMYLLAKELWGWWGGLVSSLLYIYAPYRLLDVYVRASMGESLALSLFPLILWGALQWYRTARSGFLVLSSFGYAALILTHNISALIFTPVLLIFLVICAVKTPSKGLGSILFMMALGLGLSAFYWVPALMEKEYVYIENLKMGFFDYSSHFLHFNQLFARSWGFGNSYPRLDDSMSFQIGLAHVILFPFSFYILFRAFQFKDLLTLTVLGLFQLTTFLGIFFTLEASSWLWKRISLLGFLQFPWRFLILISFSTSVLGGAIFYLRDKINSTTKSLPFCLAGLLCLSLAIWSSWNYKDSLQVVFDQRIVTKEGIRELGISSTAMLEYLPKWVSIKPNASPKQLLSDQNQNMEGSSIKVSNSNIRMNLRVKEKGQAVLNHFWFPGWQAYLDGINILTQPTKEGGLISLDIEKGEHILELRFEDTPLRRLANIISIMSLLSLLPLGIIRSWKSRSM